MGEGARELMPEGESTTQILTIIRDDVKEIRGDVKVQGQQIASISRTQEVQHENLSTLRFKVDEVVKARAECPTPAELYSLKKRLSDVTELAKRPPKFTPNGLKISIAASGFWKRLLPWLIAFAVGGAGAASHFIDWPGTTQTEKVQE